MPTERPASFDVRKLQAGEASRPALCAGEAEARCCSHSRTIYAKAFNSVLRQKSPKGIPFRHRRHRQCDDFRNPRQAAYSFQPRQAFAPAISSRFPTRPSTTTAISRCRMRAPLPQKAGRLPKYSAQSSMRSKVARSSPRWSCRWSTNVPRLSASSATYIRLAVSLRAPPANASSTLSRELEGRLRRVTICGSRWSGKDTGRACRSGHFSMNRPTTSTRFRTM